MFLWLTLRTTVTCLLLIGAILFARLTGPWLRDGGAIAFGSWDYVVGQEIYMADVSRGLVGISQYVWVPLRKAAISPSGRYLAYADILYGNRDRYVIEVMDLKTGDVKGLTTLSGRERNLGWSPDEKYLAYVRDNEIYLLHIETASLRLLAQGGAPKFDLSWSPDGCCLAYVSGTVPDIFVLHVHTQDTVQITHDSYPDASPVFVPGRNEIVFISVRSGETGIYSMDLSNGQVTPIPVQTPHTIYHLWMRDGVNLVYASGEWRDRISLHVYNRRTGRERLLTVPDRDSRILGMIP